LVPTQLGSNCCTSCTALDQDSLHPHHFRFWPQGKALCMDSSNLHGSSYDLWYAHFSRFLLKPEEHRKCITL
jgi:hypothetical protein